MFAISSSQMERLNQSMDDGFVRSAVPRLQASHPVLARSATPAGLEAVARLALARTRGYGLSQAVDFYLDLMLAFGCGFDTDPQYLWLRPFLLNMEGVSAFERVQLLRWHTSLYFGRTLRGDGGAAALERFGQLDRQTLETSGQDLRRFAPSLIEQLHPERMAYLGPEALDVLVRQAQSETLALGGEAPAAAALYLSLMFRFGHGAASDPLYPWIGDGLHGGGVENLLNRAKAFALAWAREIREATT
ncbi:MAG: hypothetical protein PHU46_01395 [Rhodocyclaceae bacterium]|nr:hypothetical protein [Rhodocyclaceae bacterium]